METTRYSYNEILDKFHTFDQLLQKSENTPYDRRLVYGLNKNLKIAQDQLKELGEQLKEFPDSYQNYIEELQQLGLECGGESETDDNDIISVKINVDGFDTEKFDKKSKSLKEKHSNTLKYIHKINTENDKFKTEKLAEVNWYILSLDWFPEELSYKELPFSIMDIIKE